MANKNLQQAKRVKNDEKIEDAIAARKKAEDELYKPILEKYQED